MVLMFMAGCLSGIKLCEAQTDPPIRVSARAWKTPESIGGPIAFNLKIHNATVNTAVVDLGEDYREGVLVEAKSPNHETVVVSKWTRKDGLSRLGLLKLSPGQTVIQQLVLQDYGIVLDAGTYEITVSFMNKSRLGGGEEISLPQVTTKLVVVDIDAAVLETSCRETSAAYLRAKDVNEAMVAAKLLARFTTEATLPCLTETYDAGSPYHNEAVLITAIGEVKTPAAKTVLEKISHGTNAEDATLASSVLVKMGEIDR